MVLRGRAQEILDEARHVTQPGEEVGPGGAADLLEQGDDVVQEHHRAHATTGVTGRQRTGHRAAVDRLAEEEEQVARTQLGLAQGRGRTPGRDVTPPAQARADAAERVRAFPRVAEAQVLGQAERRENRWGVEVDDRAEEIAIHLVEAAREVVEVGEPQVEAVVPGEPPEELELDAANPRRVAVPERLVDEVGQVEVVPGHRAITSVRSPSHGGHQGTGRCPPTATRPGQRLRSARRCGYPSRRSG